MSLIGLLAHAAKAAEAYAETPGTEGEGKYTIGPEYKIDPDLTDRGNPKGKYFEFTMRLADSKIFRGDDSTLEPDKKPVRTERKIFVYVPAAYMDGTKAPEVAAELGISVGDTVTLESMTTRWVEVANNGGDPGPPDGPKVKVSYSLTSMGCPAGPMIEEDIQNVASGVEGVQEVETDLVWDPPWTPERMSDDAKFILGFG